MPIGNALFSELAVRGFARVQAEVDGLQSEISSGKNNPRASVDQMRAAKLSVLNEQTAALAHYKTAAEQAESRLDLSDAAIGDAATALRRLTELAIQAGNGNLPDAGIEGIRLEAIEIKETLMEIGNRTDAFGQPLFSGYSAGPAFREVDGQVQYMGDNGRPSQRLSETLHLSVGVNGAELFNAVPSGGEKRDLFEMVDEMIASFKPAIYGAKASTELDGHVRLDLDVSRDPKQVSFSLSGPLGSVDIAADVKADVPGPMVDAINAQSAETGVTASIAEDGKGIILESKGTIGFSNFEREDAPKGSIGTLQQLPFNGMQGSDPVSVRPESLSQSAMVARINEMTDHFAAKRAEVGAMGATVDAQQLALEVRDVNLKTAVAGLEDLDIAAAVTRLQTLLLSQEASQQAFVKITSQTLFDYLR